MHIFWSWSLLSFVFTLFCHPSMNTCVSCQTRKLKDSSFSWSIKNCIFFHWPIWCCVLSISEKFLLISFIFIFLHHVNKDVWSLIRSVWSNFIAIYNSQIILCNHQHDPLLQFIQTVLTRPFYKVNFHFVLSNSIHFGQHLPPGPWLWRIKTSHFQIQNLRAAREADPQWDKNWI